MQQFQANQQQRPGTYTLNIDEACERELEELCNNPYGFASDYRPDSPFSHCTEDDAEYEAWRDNRLLEIEAEEAEEERARVYQTFNHQSSVLFGQYIPEKKEEGLEYS